jgi:hypothetical protein
MDKKINIHLNKLVEQWWYTKEAVGRRTIVWVQPWVKVRDLIQKNN